MRDQDGLLVRVVRLSMPLAFAVSAGVVGMTINGCGDATDRQPVGGPTVPQEGRLAPVALAAYGDSRLLALNSVGRRLVVLGRATGNRLRTIPLAARSSGLVVRGDTVYITTVEARGRTNNLIEQELNDLLEYVKSLEGLPSTALRLPRQV